MSKKRVALKRTAIISLDSVRRFSQTCKDGTQVIPLARVRRAGMDRRIAADYIEGSDFMETIYREQGEWASLHTQAPNAVPSIRLLGMVTQATRLTPRFRHA